MVNKMYNFQEQVDTTNKGTKMVVEYFEQKCPTCFLENVEASEEYRKIDIDFLLKRKGTDEIVKSIEVKVDTYRTSNIFFEYISNEELNTSGCMMKTKCDILAYYFIEQDELYLMDMDKYRNWVLMMKPRFETKSVRNSTFNSVGILVRKQDLEYNSVGVLLRKVTGLKNRKYINLISNI